MLGCSVLLQNSGKFREVFFADISVEALLVAKQNYDALIDASKYDMRMLQSDLCAFLESYQEIIKNKNLILPLICPISLIKPLKKMHQVMYRNENQKLLSLVEMMVWICIEKCFLSFKASSRK